MMLSIGTEAPEFVLVSTTNQSLSLSSLRGKKVILAFYPADWSPTCSEQLDLYNESVLLFQKHNAILLGISVDGKWCHRAFSEKKSFDFQLLADFEHKGAVSRKYEAFEEKEGQSKRALYLIDENGIIQWSLLSPKNFNPGADGIMIALKAMESK